ncbi:hypothetical protein [Pseudomonas amygdali]|uniref:Uncharacterized protein n=2 Tax=Pseudomonas amygdali pv. lachrymans TaxID=53707 RepID=A0ABR5KRH0_PSEAV|nr:hypothetical protein [Pseudomonas amygdali]AXH59972.1 hypothetical protein PLA107_032620 [Pseudomonas amygdali pv. lachrymans str. M301315]KPC17374.1 Uncharacterized protein AC499_0576 [Pseudomonas amygdali pv. lachrymans]RMT06194.1 hypothetical protein ALP54_03830 [Pseudomonas amygdali pv. lachrymans]
MTTAQSVLVSGVEHALFEKLVIQGMQGSPAKNEQQEYVDPIIRALFVGFVWGHISGFAQGAHACREVFDVNFKKGVETAVFNPTEVGTTAGLMAMDTFLKASLDDIQAMLEPAGSEAVLQISQFEHLLAKLLQAQSDTQQQKLAS